jgi:hypothetical protein
MAATTRVGAELIAASCDPGRATAQDTLACFDALRASGDHAGAMRSCRARGARRPRRSGPLNCAALAHGDSIDHASSRSRPPSRRLALSLRNQAPAGMVETRKSCEVPRSFVDMARDARQRSSGLRAAGDDPTATSKEWLSGRGTGPRARRIGERSDRRPCAHRALRGVSRWAAALGRVRRTPRERNDRRGGERRGGGARSLGAKHDACAEATHPQEGRAHPRAGSRSARGAGAPATSA